MNIIIGLIIVILGALTVIRANWLVETFGHMESAERTVGFFGGTRFILKIAGLIAIFIGFLYMTNLHEGLYEWIANIIVPG